MSAIDAVGFRVCAVFGRSASFLRRLPACLLGAGGGEEAHSGGSVSVLRRRNSCDRSHVATVKRGEPNFISPPRIVHARTRADFEVVKNSGLRKLRAGGIIDAPCGQEGPAFSSPSPGDARICGLGETEDTGQ